jgi:prepilin-type N-terminal cleavage/methylation domain-containing protein
MNINKNITRHGAFTLVEILIVVVIMGILAAIVIPQFSQSSDDARYAATIQNLQSLRGQIDLYRNQHEGKFPGNPAGANPDTDFAEQLTLPTNELGQRSSAGNQGFGDPNFPFGPYVHNRLPANPFNGSRTVQTVTAFPAAAPGGDTPTDPGWVYEVTSGRIRINKTGSTPDSQAYWSL